MPFIDLSTKSSDSFIIPPSDITIIGAGAAGILLALTLASQGKRVVMFESGHFFEDDEKQKLNEVVQTGKILENAVWGRKRALGGTTIAWGGQSLPFCSIDFEKREWVKNSGWPISFTEMEGYYKEANKFMGIDTMNYSTDIFPKISVVDPGLDQSIFDFHVSKWATQPNFLLSKKEELEKSVTVIYNAQVTQLIKNDDKVHSISVDNFAGISFTCSVNTLIVCTGTIESIRLLLNNKIGNPDCLGKFFIEHPCIEVGSINARNKYDLQRKFNTHIWQGRKYSLRLSLQQEFQRKNKLLNCSASVMFRLPIDIFDPYGELKAFKKDFKIARLIKLSGSVKSILKTTWAYLWHKFYYKPTAVAKLALMIEQEPAEDSYITVVNEKDKLNIPMAGINWQISFKTWDTVVKTATALKGEIEKLNFGKVDLYGHIKEDTVNWKDYLTDVCHHMGGARMSALPGEGVVDKDLQVWGISNLYVCSCSVFPTASHSNPTLTMLALAAKLCDHLKTKSDN